MNPELIISFCSITLIAGVCLYLAICSRSSRFEWQLVAALLLTATIELLDLIILQTPGKLLAVKPAVFVCEALLPIGWALYASSFSGRRLWNRSLASGLFWSGGLILLALSLLPDVNAMIFSPDFGSESVLSLGKFGFFFYLLLSLYLILALVMLERSYVALARHDRWCLKFEALGIGAIMAMQLVYYSQGLIHRTLDMSLVTARVAAIIFGLILFSFARMRRGRPVRLTLSRTVAFRSVVLLAVSGYLLFIGVMGEGLRYLGPSFNRALIFSLALLGGVALLVLILSESLRRKIKVFLHKHFYQQKYDYRALWVDMTGRLGNARNTESLYVAIVEMYCQTFAVQGAALYLNQGRQDGLTAVTIYSAAQMPERIDLDGSLARFFMSKQWVFNLRDNADAIPVADSEQLKSHGVEFIVPLFFDRNLGGAVVLRRQINANEPVTYEDYDLMKIFARQAAAVLFNERLSRQLASHREMAAVGKVSAFVMHDLKNLVTNLSLVVENAQELIHDSRFQKDMLETLSNTVGRMNGLIGRLKNVGESNPLSCEPYNLKQLVRETIDEIDSDGVMVSGDDVDVVIDRDEIGKVVTNLVLNGIEASTGKNNIQVEIGNDCGPLLVCRDDGCGMSDDFISSSLFRPFETTKKKGLGIGLYQCRQIVEAHGGRIEVASAIGKGSEFRVYLPSILNSEVLSDG